MVGDDERLIFAWCEVFAIPEFCRPVMRFCILVNH